MNDASSVNSPQPSADTMAYARRQVGTRVSTACERCRRRKIRCDGQMPACRPCQKVKAACVFEHRGSARPIASSSGASHDLAEARSRIRQLENQLLKEQKRNDRASGPSAPLSSPRGDLSLYNDATISTPREQVHATDQGSSQSFETSIQTSATANAIVDAQPGQSLVPPESHQPALAHEIGLVSLTPGSEARYIGPSSGFFFARKIMGTLNKKHNTEAKRKKTEELRTHLNAALAKDIEAAAVTPLPSTLSLCKLVSAHYFRTVHIELPFMHEGQHMAVVDRIYDDSDPGPLATFQVNMVLAIAAADLSKRLKVSINADQYFANAQRLLDKFSTEGSLKGLQCLLLLVVFAMNQPSTGLNAWYLHYETIASVLDLGLQRDVSKLAIPIKEQEMRTRIFWVVYSLDRRLATIMGRPIGLRDEACELRFPLDVDDDQLDSITATSDLESGRVTHLTWAIQLFKLAQMNSEIKYVLHSISKDSGHYCFAPVTNVLEWQQGMISRLDQWTSIVQSTRVGEAEEGSLLKQIWLQRCHEMYILLLWPSPAIRVPHESVMIKCYQHAQSSLSLITDLYQNEQLVYNTTTIHSVFVSALTMLYCLSAIPNMASSLTQPLHDIEKFHQSINVLSSLGEHWNECRKARDGLVHVARPIIHKVLHDGGFQSAPDPSDSQNSRSMIFPTSSRSQTNEPATPASFGTLGFDDFLPSMDAFMDPDFFMAQFEGFSATEDPPSDNLVDPLLSGP